MNEEQTERMIVALEKIADGFQEKKNTIIKLKIYMYLYGFSNHKITESKTYIQIVDIPYPMNISMGSNTTLNFEERTFSGPEFYLDDLYMPVFNHISAYNFDEKDKLQKKKMFEKEHHDLLQKGWQLINEYKENNNNL